jgi:hypothetical protein
MELPPIFINQSDFKEMMSAKVYSFGDHELVKLTDLATYGTHVYELRDGIKTRIDPRDLYVGQLAEMQSLKIRSPQFHKVGDMRYWMDIDHAQQMFNGLMKPIPAIVPEFHAVVPPWFSAKPIPYLISELWSHHD